MKRRRRRRVTLPKSITGVGGAKFGLDPAGASLPIGGNSDPPLVRAPAACVIFWLGWQEQRSCLAAVLAEA